MGSTPKNASRVQPPKGTRDFYPNDLLRSRYITNAWRDASIRCGFDEIAGPTFESSDLYSVKSGEGILGELFQAFSGKSEAEIEEVQSTGRAPYALRPEFTPTLARMYAAHAKQLPKPCKWFTAGPYFRAERPQRGRLREFLQWNVDAIGDATADIDAEVIGTATLLFDDLCITPADCKIQYNNRQRLEQKLLSHGIPIENHASWYNVIDQAPKISLEKLIIKMFELDPEDGIAASMLGFMLGQRIVSPPDSKSEIELPDEDVIEKVYETARQGAKNWQAQYGLYADAAEGYLDNAIHTHRLENWCVRDSSIVRGLAYYTGTVFEAIADGERAVAGGGRYDNLIELFGGPPTPACGFGMGDVVLGNLLDDKGLMPEGPELMEAVARPQASIRPVAFVAPNGDESNEPLVHALTANLRRGIESEAWLARDDRKPWQTDRYAVSPMHARISYKSSRNMKKLRADAEKQHARYFVEIHAEDKVELTDMDRRESLTSDTHGSFSVDPSAPNYVGTAIAARR